MLTMVSEFVLSQTKTTPQDHFFQASKTYIKSCHRMKDNLRSLFSSCWKKNEDEQADELRPLIRGKKEKKPFNLEGIV